MRTVDYYTLGYSIDAHVLKETLGLDLDCSFLSCKLLVLESNHLSEYLVFIVSVRATLVVSLGRKIGVNLLSCNAQGQGYRTR